MGRRAIDADRVLWVCLWMSLGVIAGCKGSESVTAESTPAEIWKSTCSRCHNFDGSGTSRLGNILDMRSARWQGEKTDAQLEETIRKGKRNDRGGIMEAYGGRLTDAQIKGLVEYIRNEIPPKKAKEPPAPQPAATP